MLCWDAVVAYWDGSAMGLALNKETKLRRTCLEQGKRQDCNL